MDSASRDRTMIPAAPTPGAKIAGDQKSLSHIQRGRVFADSIEDAHWNAGLVERPNSALDMSGVADARVGHQQHARTALSFADRTQLREQPCAKSNFYAGAGN